MEPVMNIREIEETLFLSREAIQEAVELTRQNQLLKKMAELLLYHVNEIKLERERIMMVNIDNVIPLHLVCLKYGLPYHAAERIMAINTIKKPNFTFGRQSIYAR